MIALDDYFYKRCVLDLRYLFFFNRESKTNRWWERLAELAHLPLPGRRLLLVALAAHPGALNVLRGYHALQMLLGNRRLRVSGSGMCTPMRVRVLSHRETGRVYTNVHAVVS